MRPSSLTCVPQDVVLTSFVFAVGQVNGEMRQNAVTSEMIFRIPRLIEHVSSIMTLEVISNSPRFLTSQIEFIWSLL